jgi:CPA1 family monovalent cation:H+ antiporter
LRTGALSLVLALALPVELPDRSLIVVLTAGTVMVSLVGQGATMSAVLRHVGLVGTVDTRREGPVTSV